jgi:hypothetical protein
VVIRGPIGVSDIGSPRGKSWEGGSLDSRSPEDIRVIHLGGRMPQDPRILRIRHRRVEQGSLLTSRLAKSRRNRDRPFWRIGGRDLGHIVDSGIVSWEAEAFSLQSSKS